MVNRAKELGLNISPKSVVGTNTKGLAEKIAGDINRFAKGNFLKASSQAKDLGVTTVVGGKSRVTTDQKNRRMKMGKRAKVLKHLIGNERESGITCGLVPSPKVLGGIKGWG